MSSTGPSSVNSSSQFRTGDTSASASPAGSAVLRARAIAMYLPQFHPIPENDEWWGKGFTEWTNTAKAKPKFHNHYQPHIPADLGFYDLRVPETREAQAAMARQYGIEGFCYYHYWFAGRRLLQRPLDDVLRSGKPDFPFCVSWANRSWTGIWHGAPDRVLIEQTFPGRADHEAHFEALLSTFRDRRYIRVDGKPLFLIHAPDNLPDSAETLALWRNMATEAGLSGLHIAGVSYSRAWDPIANGFDARINQGVFEHPSRRQPIAWLRSHINRWRGLPKIASARAFSSNQMLAVAEDDVGYPCVIHAWDNTPRSGQDGVVLQNATPESFQSVLEAAVRALESRSPERRLLFLKSWNEWAEGNHLEPDLRFGHKFLEATGRALSVPSTSQ
jgi:lipopolysaccharide biosynthesis protein